MPYNYKMGSTFSNCYKHTGTMMTRMRYNLYECDKFTDYKIEIKNTFKCNSRNSAVRIMSNNKLFSEKITDYKIYRKQCD